MSFSLIAAIGKHNELGKRGGLVFKIPGDLKFFKETTMGHPVFMGLNTWRSLPSKLPGRDHYVLTPDAKEVEGDDVTPVTDLNKFIKEHKDTDEEIFVIGGGMVYTQMLPHCKSLYLTEVDASDPDADTYFPEFDKHHYNWRLLGGNKDNGISYSHMLYTRKDIPFITIDQKDHSESSLLKNKKLYNILKPYEDLDQQMSNSDNKTIDKTVSSLYSELYNSSLMCSNYLDIIPPQFSSSLTPDFISNLSIIEAMAYVTMIQRADHFDGGYGGVYPKAVKSGTLPAAINRIIKLYEEHNHA